MGNFTKKVLSVVVTGIISTSFISVSVSAMTLDEARSNAVMRGYNTKMQSPDVEEAVIWYNTLSYLVENADQIDNVTTEDQYTTKQLDAFIYSNYLVPEFGYYKDVNMMYNFGDYALAEYSNFLTMNLTKDQRRLLTNAAKQLLECRKMKATMLYSKNYCEKIIRDNGMNPDDYLYHEYDIIQECTKGDNGTYLTLANGDSSSDGYPYFLTLNNEVGMGKHYIRTIKKGKSNMILFEATEETPETTCPIIKEDEMPIPENLTGKDRETYLIELDDLNLYINDYMQGIDNIANDTFNALKNPTADNTKIKEYAPYHGLG